MIADFIVAEGSDLTVLIRAVGPSYALESAILINLARGAYTAVLSPVESQDHGTALAELYKFE